MTAVQNEVPIEVATVLLKLHWCWIHPMSMFVYRPAFTSKSFIASHKYGNAKFKVGGMALRFPTELETPYFSEMLLAVILADGARFKGPDRESSSKLMVELTEKAHFSLPMTLAKPSKFDSERFFPPWMEPFRQQSPDGFARN